MSRARKANEKILAKYRMKCMDSRLATLQIAYKALLRILDSSTYKNDVMEHIKRTEWEIQTLEKHMSELALISAMEDKNV